MMEPYSLWRPYIDAPAKLAAALTNTYCRRTDAFLASIQGTITTITRGDMVTPTLIAQSMPCLIVDIAPGEAIGYAYQGTTLQRIIPLAISVVTPLFSANPDLSAQERASYEQLADQDIKQLYGDLEDILFQLRATPPFGKEMLLIDSPGIWPFGVPILEESHIRARVAELHVANFGLV